MDIHERAARAKVRFLTSKGNLAYEDLYDLSLTSLDTIAKKVNRQLKDETEESFIETKSAQSSELELKLDLLKHVIASKLKDAERAQKTAETKAKMSQIREILLEKSNEDLKGKSPEELKEILAELES